MKEEIKEDVIPIVTCNGRYKMADVNTVVHFPGTTDAIFYNLLHEKMIAARLVSLLTGKEALAEEITYGKAEFKDVLVRNVYMDVHFFFPDLNVNFEMQKTAGFGNRKKNLEERMMERLIYHSAKLLSDDTDKGDVRYLKRPVYVVCFYEEGYNDYKKWCVNYQYASDASAYRSEDSKISVVLLKNKENAPDGIRQWLELLSTHTPLLYKGADEVMDKAVDIIYSSNDDKDIREILLMRELQEQAIRVEHHAEIQHYEETIEDQQILIKNQKTELENQKTELDKAYQEKISLICLLHRNGIMPEDISKETGIPLDEVRRILGL